MQLEWNGSCGGAPGGVPFWFTAAPLAQIAPSPIQLRPVPPLLPATTAPRPSTAVFA